MLEDGLTLADIVLWGTFVSNAIPFSERNLKVCLIYLFTARATCRWVVRIMSSKVSSSSSSSSSRGLL